MAENRNDNKGRDGAQNKSGMSGMGQQDNQTPPRAQPMNQGEGFQGGGRTGTPFNPGGNKASGQGQSGQATGQSSGQSTGQTTQNRSDYSTPGKESEGRRGQSAGGRTGPGADTEPL